MSTLVYKDHTIIAGAKRDKITGKYKPIVHIAWQGPNGQRGVHSFTLPQRCSTFEQGSVFAYEAAKIWVDRHGLLGEGSE
jgi:hypothetical protein